MPKMPGRPQWIEPGKNNDISDMEELLKGNPVVTTNNKKKPKFRVLPRGNVPVEITEVSMTVRNVKKVIIKLGKKPNQVSKSQTWLKLN